MANDYLGRGRDEANARARAAAANWVAPGSSAQAVKKGVLTEKVITCEVTGRKSREFVGDKSVWMSQFEKPRYIQLRINNNPNPTPEGLTLSDVTKVVSQ